MNSRKKVWKNGCIEMRFYQFNKLWWVKHRVQTEKTHFFLFSQCYQRKVSLQISCGAFVQLFEFRIKNANFSIACVYGWVCVWILNFFLKWRLWRTMELKVQTDSKHFNFCSIFFCRTKNEMVQFLMNLVI